MADAIGKVHFFLFVNSELALMVILLVVCTVIHRKMEAPVTTTAFRNKKMPPDHLTAC